MCANLIKTERENFLNTPDVFLSPDLSPPSGYHMMGGLSFPIRSHKRPFVPEKTFTLRSKNNSLSLCGNFYMYKLSPKSSSETDFVFGNAALQLRLRDLNFFATQTPQSKQRIFLSRTKQRILPNFCVVCRSVSLETRLGLTAVHVTAFGGGSDSKRCCNILSLINLWEIT